MTTLALSNGLAWLTHLWEKERVWLVTAAILLALAVTIPAQAVESAIFTVNALVHTAPYLIASIAVAAYATASGADRVIGKAFQGAPAVMIILASLIGGLSPFCSCGVIPLIAALLAMNVPLAAIMAFWLASPVIDPSMFVLTAGLLDMEFAIAKTLTAVGLGLAGGFITHAMVGLGAFADPMRPGVKASTCGTSSIAGGGPVAWAFWREADRRGRFARSSLSTTLFLAKWLSLAFLLESLMVAYLPAGTIANVLGGEGLMPVATATIVGVPAYLNGYAALPLVGELVAQGMTAGAGLAFLVAGGVTSLPAAIAVWALVKKPVFALYIALALVGSFLAGVLFDIWHLI